MSLKKQMDVYSNAFWKSRSKFLSLALELKDIEAKTEILRTLDALLLEFDSKIKEAQLKWTKKELRK